MPDTVPVTIKVDPAAAVALGDEAKRVWVGRVVSRMLRPRQGPSDLARAIADAKAEARYAGLTDGEIDAELENYNAERRGSPAA